MLSQKLFCNIADDYNKKLQNFHEGKKISFLLVLQNLI